MLLCEPDQRIARESRDYLHKAILALRRCTIVKALMSCARWPCSRVSVQEQSSCPDSLGRIDRTDRQQWFELYWAIISCVCVVHVWAASIIPSVVPSDDVVVVVVAGDVDSYVLLEYVKTVSPLTHGLEGRVSFRQTPLCNCPVSSDVTRPTTHLAAATATVLLLVVSTCIRGTGFWVSPENQFSGTKIQWSWCVFTIVYVTIFK